MARYTLMNKEVEVLDFEYDEVQRAVLSVEKVHDLRRAPLSIWNERIKQQFGADNLASFVGRWWAARGIPESRFNLKETKQRANFESPRDLVASAFGFSLSDQYWVRPFGSGLTWAGNNFFQNPFDEEMGRILAGISLDSGNPSPRSPSATVDGNLPKMWRLGSGGVRELLKAGSGSLKQEPFNEVVATLLYSRLFPDSDYVAYRLEKQDAGFYSVCACFVDQESEFTTAKDIYWAAPTSMASPTYEGLLAAAAALGADGLPEQLNRILVCDYILGNIDRHLGNFGVVRHAENGSILHNAPLFDTGLSLLCYQGETNQDALAVMANPFMPRQNQQLALVQDASWFDDAVLDGFAEEAIEVLRTCPSRYMDSARLGFIEAFITSGIQTVAAYRDRIAQGAHDADEPQRINNDRERFLKVCGAQPIFVV